MTKFKNYIINEYYYDDDTGDFDNQLVIETMELIASQCKPWLSAVKSCKQKVVFRGVRLTSAPIINKTVRTDRVPLDTSTSHHDIWDALILKHWGWKARSSGLFVTGEYGVSLDYGDDAYLVFPKGRLGKFLWSPKIPDMFRLALKIESSQERIIKKEYMDKNLCKAISSGHEIMIQCRSYYGIKGSVVKKYMVNEVGYKFNSKSSKGLEMLFNKFVEQI